MHLSFVYSLEMNDFQLFKKMQLKTLKNYLYNQKCQTIIRI